MLSRLIFPTLVAIIAHLSSAGPTRQHRHTSAWEKTKFKSLVSFGDSYTDDSRLNYFLDHDGSPPPVGWIDPANYKSSSGGRPWPQYVAQYGGLNIYNYAVSGAICDSKMIPQQRISASEVFPGVDGYEVPAYLANKAYTPPGAKTPFLDVPASRTAYSIWIGTNDVGVNGFVGDKQAAGANLTSYLDCVYAQVGRLYESGARFFVLQNLAPLQLSPLYGFPSAGGVQASEYWPDKPNATLIAERMTETVATVNSIYRYRTESEVLVQERYPGANFAVFDMEGLLGDVYHRPAAYLNGTAEPLNVTGTVNKCSPDKVCVRSQSPDSYLWFDDLHPSEQTDRVIAREFLGVLGGKSKWARYYSCSS